MDSQQGSIFLQTNPFQRSFVNDLIFLKLVANFTKVVGFLQSIFKGMPKYFFAFASERSNDEIAGSVKNIQYPTAAKKLNKIFMMGDFFLFIVAY